MENQEKEPQKPEQKKDSSIMGFMMFEAGIEFALLIAAPLIGAVFLGKWLDSKWHTHFVIIIAILFALAVSSMAIAKRIKDYKRILNIK